MSRTLEIAGRTLGLTRGDITQFRTDALVNAANRHLQPGAGVDGALRAAGGPDITRETDRIGGCATGGAVATTAGRLPARYIIHAVAPIWRGGNEGEPEHLASAYRTAMSVADELGVESIAFPSLGTGIYGYPVQDAAPIALRAVRDALTASRSVRSATFVLFSEHDLGVYEHCLSSLAAS
jgi:O-acetyl-ADP-ribose deacetylase (regulator of RNase III)